MTKRVPAAPALDSVGSVDHPALGILGEVAAYLSAGIGTEDLFLGIVDVLRRGLDARPCRIWFRTPDGSAYRSFAPVGDPLPSGETTAAVPGWVAGHETEQLAGGQWQLRYPLEHEGESLGLLEAWVPDGDGMPVARQVLGIVARFLSPLLWSTELSEDLASEVALRTREIESQRRFTGKIIDSLPVGIYVIDRAYVIQAWNRKRETGTHEMNKEETLGRSVFEVLHRQSRELLKAEFDSVFATGRMEQVEVESGATGSPRHYRITKIPMRLNDDAVTHVITIGEDVTEWKNIQKQIAHSEKLAAIGQFAAGIMHEINNPLATIGACVEAFELHREAFPRESRRTLDEYLRIMESELERCKGIVDGLLDFARPKASPKAPVSLNQLVEDALYLVKHHERLQRIRVERHLADDLPDVMASAKQLLQVFLNLMVNAMDAMGGEGTLTVTTSVNPQRRDEVMVAVEDTGHGIAREDLAKIFEPFYTTKATGRGTGLGLSVSYSIVAEHGGRITVDSHPNRGSTFRVILPAQGVA